MRLILTEYINALKEDGELDKLIQDLLRSYGIEIFTRPEKGRQFGVDIYAVGKDFEDGNKKKVFLITVKQGDLDRQTWNADQNSVQQSLDEIRTVFIRNNLAPQHKKLPIKIVVALNGMMKQSVQQNWVGYTEANKGFDFVLWQIDFLVENVQQQLLNEQAFSNETRSLIRKTIIHLEDPNYDLKHFTLLLKQLITQFTSTKIKKAKLKSLKELHLIVSIILKYCEEAGNQKHAVQCAEKYILVLWEELSKEGDNKEYLHQLIAAYHTLMESFARYYHKLAYVANIRDGFSRQSRDSLTYTYSLYGHVGIFSLFGLIILQMHELFDGMDGEDRAVVRESLANKAFEVGQTVIAMINNNNIFYNPRADEQHIEICLVFILLYKLKQFEDIRSLLQLLNQQIGEGLAFLKVFPEFSNDLNKIAELEADFSKRLNYEYKASNLFTVLVEWAVVMKDHQHYTTLKGLKDTLLPECDLVLWFPEKETESIIYNQTATLTSGYCLSNIALPDTLEEYQEIMKEEYLNNCHEKEFSFIKQPIWTIGLIASRHYRAYVFPYYWRQFL